MREFIDIVETAMKDGREFSLRHFEDNYDGLTCVTVIAEIDGKEIGYATYDCDGGFVRTVEVDASYRRQGIATSIYDYIEDLGYPVKPSPAVEPDGRAFWDARRSKLDEKISPEQFAPLYHCTTLGAMEVILSDGYIFGGSGRICVTRDRNFRINDAAVQIVLDAGRIRQRYRVEPYDYYGRQGAKDLRRSESEERIFTYELPIQYIKEVIVRPMTAGPKVAQRLINRRIKTIKKLAEHHGIIFTLRKAETISEDTGIVEGKHAGRWWWNIRSKEEFSAYTHEHTNTAQMNAKEFGVDDYPEPVTPIWDSKFLKYVMSKGWVRCHETPSSNGLYINALTLTDAQACLRHYLGRYVEFIVDIGFEYNELSRKLTRREAREYLKLRDTTS